MALFIDMRREDRGALFGYSKRCGVLCESCGWRGYRLVRFGLSRTSDYQTYEATSRIKGVKSNPDCPGCLKHSVVFTHAPS